MPRYDRELLKNCLYFFKKIITYESITIPILKKEEGKNRSKKLPCNNSIKHSPETAEKNYVIRSVKKNNRASGLTVDAIFIIQQILDKAIEFNKHTRASWILRKQSKT